MVNILKDLIKRKYNFIGKNFTIKDSETIGHYLEYKIFSKYINKHGKECLKVKIIKSNIEGILNMDTGFLLENRLNDIEVE